MSSTNNPPLPCEACRYALHQSGLCSNSQCHSHYDPSGPLTMTVAELLEDYAEVPLFHGRQWGDWQLDTERLTLDYKPDGVWRYEIDLERVRDSASLLDWIFQIAGKSWATPKVTRDLLRALDDIFEPQANLCSVGMGKKISPSFVAKRLKPCD